MMTINALLPAELRESMSYLYIEDPVTPQTSRGYVVIEQYCTNLQCHCEEVAVQILLVDDNYQQVEQEPALAVRYNWAKKKLYREKNEKTKAHHIEKLLFKAYKKLSADPAYITRLKEHYRRTRQLANDLPQTIISHKADKLSRNAPCLCGSGKKYKKCCLNKQ